MAGSRGDILSVLDPDGAEYGKGDQRAGSLGWRRLIVAGVRIIA